MTKIEINPQLFSSVMGGHYSHEFRGIMQAYYDQYVFNYSVTGVQLTAVGTLMYVVLNLVSPMCHVLKSHFGPKIMIISGTIIMSLGLILAGFSTKIWHLYLTQGIMYGIGGSLMFTTAMGIAPQWFDKRRGLALGICASGSGIGGLIFPFIMNPLLERLGAPWCYRILGFISLALGLFASMFIKERFPQKGKKLGDLMHFSIAKESTFLVWIAGADLCLLGYMVPFYLIPTYAQDHGMTASQGASLISVLSAFNFLGRIVTGFWGDYIGRLNTEIICMVLSGLFVGVIWVFATSYGVLVAFCVLYGFTCGAYFALMSPVTALVTGIERYANCFSVFLVLQAVGYCGAPIAEAIQSATGPGLYLSAQLFSCFTFILGAICMFILKLKMTKRVFSKI
ncbi:hypothetical protein INT43_002454 [Umbelopsis isabellina]|uniref:Major facilitator superfamily (MFS) profile domain-containing protein n=1 Tax=Mortierella isabellina TaxID=91625 RepID=A0A8H7Q778_MORIS|nr:hypothetical protein INT43_002454 [Umbelopsis isabellina]